MDISYELEIIQNLIQSGKLDDAFVEHNKLIDKKDIDFESSAQVDLIYVRLLLEIGEGEKASNIMTNLLESKDKIKSETVRLAIDIYFAISMVYAGKIDEAGMKINEIEETIPKLKKINVKNSRALLSELYNIKGIINFRYGNMENALSEYNQSINLSREINYRKDEARTLFNMASLYDQKGDSATALSYFTKALEIFNDIQFYEGILPCMTRLKNLQIRLGNDEAVYNLDQKMMDYQLHLELRKCRISSSRMDFELNNQIIDLISERNKLEQKIWELEFQLNSQMTSGQDLTQNVSRLATEKLENLKGEMGALYEKLNINQVELNNLREERERLKEELDKNKSTFDIILKQNKELEEKLKNSSSSPENDSLKQALAEKERELSNIKQDMDKQFEQKLNKKQQIIKELEKEVDDLRKALEMIKKGAGEIEQLREFKDKADGEIKSLKSQLENQKSESKSQQTQLKELLTTEQERVKTLETSLEAGQTIEVELEQRDLEINRLRQENMDKEQEITSLRNEKIQAIKKLEAENEKKLQDLQEENQSLIQQISLHEKLVRDTSIVSKSVEEIEKAPISSKEPEPQTIKPTEVESRIEPQTTDIESKKSFVSSQTVKPSEIAKRQEDEISPAREFKPSSAKIGRVYHKNISVDSRDLSSFLDGDKLAENVYNTIKSSRSIQLRFLAMRLGASMPKVMEIIKSLESIGVIKIRYSEGNENNPTIEIK
ncbi:MAG: tetratricopeptide repeat protein [Candidatus Heimdallarchaeota archaeon]|nr:tetratricopeptide repeat protein [Candidatus Heimdallarchaeota archaeon]